MATRDIAEGRLETVLDEYAPAAWWLSAMYPASRHLSPKVRVFVDHLVEAWQSQPWLPLRTPTAKHGRSPRQSAGK